MKRFVDLEHDIDSCKDVWDNFYKIIYQEFFGKYFDFSKIEDVETNPKCKRWYIKLRDDIEVKDKFPKFKMAGDCIFNFNPKKIDILNKYVVNTNEGQELLKECAGHHHSFENFAFMPITGGMNDQKGRQILDRPDIHVREISSFFENKESRIFSNARRNKEALEWYLSLFNNDIIEYVRIVYMIDDVDFINNSFLKFSNVNVKDENTAIQYMKLAKEFWIKRKQNIEVKYAHCYDN